MKWGICEQISCHSPIGWNQDEIPYWDETLEEYRIYPAPIGSPEYAEIWHDFLTHFKQHLESKGWFEKAVLFMDEIPEDQMKTVIEIIKSPIAGH